MQTQPAPPDEATEFATFMRAYQDMVFTTAARLTGDDAQAEDLSQAVFLKAYEQFGMLRSSPTAGGWLKTVATRLALNHLSRYRKRWRLFSELHPPAEQQPAEDPPEQDFPARENVLEVLETRESSEAIERALMRLPEHQRVPMVLYHLEDMSYQDISSALGVSLSKVKTDIHRARVALASLLVRSDLTTGSLIT